MELKKRTISIALEGINQNELLRCKRIFETLLKHNILSLKRATAELSFDHQGELRNITFHTTVFKSDQPDIPSVRIFESVKMEIVGLPQTIRSDFSNEWTPDEKAMMRK